MYLRMVGCRRLNFTIVGEQYNTWLGLHCNIIIIGVLFVSLKDRGGGQQNTLVYIQKHIFYHGFFHKNNNSAGMMCNNIVFMSLAVAVLLCRHQ